MDKKNDRVIRYSMTQVENITGIKAHTLRIWEKRYGYIKARRTKSNIRYYTESQLKELLNVAFLLNHGYKISSVVKLSPGEMANAVAELYMEKSVEISDEINRLSMSMLELDERSIRDIIKDSISSRGLTKTILDVIYPFLRIVGSMWTGNRATPAHEHFVSQIIRQILLAEIQKLPLASNDAPGIVLFLMENESHELSLIFANYLARKNNWRTFYLGADVPHSDIPIIVAKTKAKLIFTNLTLSRTDHLKDQLEEISSAVNVPFLVSGPVEYLNVIKDYSGVRVVRSPGEYEEMLLSIATKY